MDVLVLVGRALFALVFLGAGVGHLTQRQMMAGYAASKGVPFAVPTTVVSGVVIIAGGLMVAVGVWPDIGALLLVGFLVPTAFVMHGFWGEADPAVRANEQSQFLKDLSLAGAALALFALFAYIGQDLGYVVVGPLLDLS